MTTKDNALIKEIDAVIDTLTKDDDLSEEGKRKDEHVRKMWADLRAIYCNRSCGSYSTKSIAAITPTSQQGAFQ
jgi:hypothetical protein